MISHDRLFKELFSVFFVEFVELFLPDLAAYLDKTSISFLDKELFADLLTGERQEADLVVKARCLGQEAFFLVLLESQDQPQPHFSRRMFFYFALLQLKYGLPVYPIAVFTSASAPPQAGVYKVEFPGWEVLHFEYRAIHLARLKWRDYLRQQNPLAAALMAKMGMAPEERPRVKLECLRLLATLKLDRARMHLISGFIDTYLRLNAEETLLFRQQADTLLGSTEKGQIMEIVTSWMEEGIKRGLEQGLERGLEQGLERGLERGRQEGRQEGQRQVVLRLLRRRLGALDETAERQVSGLPGERLADLAEALLDFRTPSDLGAWLQSH